MAGGVKNKMKFNSRIPIYRMSRIRQKLLRRERFNASTLAAEFEVTTKTVHRDVAFMREISRLRNRITSKN